MRTALRFLQIVQGRVSAPSGTVLTFGGVALTFNGAALTFQPA